METNDLQAVGHFKKDAGISPLTDIGYMGKILRVNFGLSADPGREG